MVVLWFMVFTYVYMWFTYLKLTCNHLGRRMGQVGSTCPNFDYLIWASIWQPRERPVGVRHHPRSPASGTPSVLGSSWTNLRPSVFTSTSGKSLRSPSSLSSGRFLTYSPCTSTRDSWVFCHRLTMIDPWDTKHQGHPSACGYSKRRNIASNAAFILNSSTQKDSGKWVPYQNGAMGRKPVKHMVLLIWIALGDTGTHWSRKTSSHLQKI